MNQHNPTSWNIKDPRELYRIATGNELSYGSLHIMRLAPGKGALTLDWNDFEADAGGSRSYSLYVRPRGQAESEATRLSLPGASGRTTVTGLENNTDYEIWLQSSDSVVSPTRLFRPGHVPGTVINYMHPEDYIYGFSGRSPASPSIVRLADGTMLASHDVYWGNEGQNTSIVFRSSDDGASWEFVNFLYPCFWGKLFVHRNRLYMISTSTEYGALLIGGSDDGGETWTQPAELIAAGSREAGGPHKAPMPVIEHKGRLWTGIDYGSWTTGSHRSGLVSVPADSDLLDPANWTIMPFLPYDPNWPGTVVGGSLAGLLEGNAVVTPDGALVNLLRYQTNGGTPSHGRAIMLAADPDHPERQLTFYKVVPFHGNLSKFTVYYDDVSRKYWSLVSKVTGPNISMRNVLALVCSDDLEQWTVVKDILDYEHNGWPEDSKKVGFQYVDWMFHGDDIRFASRTAINGAHNFHNANYMTYHVIEQFRSLVASE
ncbi:sialidase family protein [Paenibacillus ginsengarvi]|uniref:Exo-alpha-sialidase n=1 Tax=Paenibacillus ginsengarvi TaxID=400777 RepID=A0A3B0C9C4_9BACL|nr:sialidase family protein [Paenibacillus ginsengarvi]RKN80537.1 exo-alpha-sialidase [Paenibacillus ginsengarvi]